MFGSLLGGLPRVFNVLSNVGSNCLYAGSRFKQPLFLANRNISLSGLKFTDKNKYPGGGDRGNGIIDTDGYNLNLDKKSQQKLEKFKKIIEKNSYYEKYRTKIVESQKSSPKSFLGLIEQLVSVGKEAAGFQKVKMNTSSKNSLNEVMKLEMLLKVERDDIVFIWQEYHHGLNMIAATMNCQMFDRMCMRGNSFRIFVLPLPKREGYEMFLVEYSRGSFYFTPMIKYQLHKENAPVCLSLIHYTELSNAKDLILMRGECDKDSISLVEAQFLTVQLNLYYGEGDEQRLNILKVFNDDPSAFQHMLVIEELKRMQTDYPHLFPELQ